MALSMLSSSATWYTSRICDGHPLGYVAFGASNSVYVVNVLEKPPKYLSHFAAHAGRISSVSLCGQKEPILCTTAGEDGKIRVYDIITKKLLHEHSQHKGAPQVVDWSSVDVNRIISGDDRGGLILWKISTGETQLFRPENENSSITTLHWSPHDANSVLFGNKNGTAVILDVNSGNIVHKLRGHDEEIHCVCWAPFLGEDLEAKKYDLDNPEDEIKSSPKELKGCLVATSSRDRTIRIWSSTTSRCLQSMRLPPSQSYRNKHEDYGKAKAWVALNWPLEIGSKLISSSYNGEILVWDLEKPGKFKSQVFKAGELHRCHSRNVFSICTAGDTTLKVVSSGMDRQLIVWDLENLSGEYSIPGLGGFAYSLAQSSVNPGHLAIGCGDNLIRIWNVDNAQNPFEVQTFWQGIKSKVTSLSWHPQKEGLLAYGTDDGRVGVYNVLSAKGPTVSSTYHKKTVYVVTWGPVTSNDESTCSNEINVYSVGDGIVLQHHYMKLESEAQNINYIIKKTNNIKVRFPIRSEIQWKSDLKIVAIGNDDGSIEIMKAPNLQRLCVVHVHVKLINCIRWHPLYTAENSNPSTRQNWIATGSNSALIHVINLDPYLESDENVCMRSDYQLEGHTSRITDMAWSFHLPGHLASVSFDNTAQIWDVINGTQIANYRGHNGRLLCVVWSAIQPNVVYTGAQDNSVQAWSIYEQEHKSPPEASYHDKKFIKPARKTKVPVSVNVTTTDDELAEVQKLIQERRMQILKEKEVKVNEQEVSEAKPVLLDKVLVTDVHVDGYPEVKKDGKKNKKRHKALWPLSNKMDNRGKALLHQDCIDLLEVSQKGDDSNMVALPDEQFYIGHFVDRKSTYGLLEKEGKHHVETGCKEQCLTIEMFKGNLAGTLKEAAAAGELSDWHVSLATAASPALWRDMCGQYALQLEKEGVLQKAATYHLARNDVHSAINMFMRNKAFKDAVCLAQVRLMSNDPLLKGLYTAWAEHAISEGNFEIAARCYITIQKPLEAARLLMRRTDLTALRAATYLAMSSGEKEAITTYVRKFVNLSLIKCEWDIATEVINKYESLKPYGLVISVHEVLIQQLKSILPEVVYTATETAKETSDQVESTPETNKTNTRVDDSVDHINEDIKDENICNPNTIADVGSYESSILPPFHIGNSIFTSHIIGLWHSTWNVALQTETLKQYYKDLLAYTIPAVPNSHTRQVVVDVSFEIVLGIIKLINSETEEALLHWTRAIAYCVQSDKKQIAITLCSILLPTGINDQELEKMFKLVSDSYVSLYPESSPIQITTTFIYDKEKTLSCINNISCSLTIRDALKAYFSLCCLYHMKPSRDDVKGPAAVGTETTKEDSTPGEKADINGSENTEGPSPLIRLDKRAFCRLSSSLLKDDIVEKFKLEDSLKYIEKVMASLISKNKMRQQGDAPGGDEIHAAIKDDAESKMEGNGDGSCAKETGLIEKEDKLDNQSAIVEVTQPSDVIASVQTETKEEQVQNTVNEEQNVSEMVVENAFIDLLFEREEITLKELASYQEKVLSDLKKAQEKYYHPFPAVLESLDLLVDSLSLIQDSSEQQTLATALMDWVKKYVYTNNMLQKVESKLVLFCSE